MITINGFVALLWSGLLGMGLIFFGLMNDFFFIIAIFLGVFVLKGFFVIQPKEAVIGLFFGKYIGEYKEEGFWWTNPLNSLTKVSLKVHSFETTKSKITDKEGKPVEVSVTITWKVINPYEAEFRLENYQNYMRTQSEAVIRSVLTSYTYNDIVEDKDVIGIELTKRLDKHMNPYGLDIGTSQISHIAYAREVAGDMLQKQKAKAIIEAREELVKGATSIVRTAVENLEEKDDKGKYIKFEDSEKSRLVSNLLVVLVGSKDAEPVVNLD